MEKIIFKHYCPVCQKEPKLLFYQGEMKLSLPEKDGTIKAKYVGAKIDVIHMLCSQCRTVLSTFGNPDKVQTNPWVKS